MRLPARLVALPTSVLAIFVAACSSTPPATSEDQATSTAPPPRVKTWMDRLTVKHEYDPKTGFIVARETVALPPLIRDAPPLDAAIAQAGSARTVIVFVTADRCAPCQQYKRDALNDEAVVARLADARFLPTHLEVDRSPALADAHLGTRSIPMTYALRDGKVAAELRGQRSAAELIAWIDALPE
jgi:thiol:disulfide interchange protein